MLKLSSTVFLRVFLGAIWFEETTGFTFGLARGAFYCTHDLIETNLQYLFLMIALALCVYDV
jgi:hypothetical protein